MAKLDEVRATNAKMLESVRKNTDATSAVGEYLGAIKAELTDVSARLAEAIANNVSDEEIAALMAEQNAVIEALDADTAAEAILAGTPADPTA